MRITTTTLMGLGFLWAATVSFSGFGQTGINETQLISACAGVVTDTGGSGAGYGQGESESITICPPPGEETVWIEWQVFELDPTSEISVYDGDAAVGFPLGQGSNDELAGSVFVASAFNVSGCLTITFTSGVGDDVEGDFAFSINCGQPCDVPIPVVNPLEASPYRTCPGEETLFDGASSLSGPLVELVEWRWDWDGDGLVDETNDNAYTSHVFEEPGIYRVQMSVVDEEGCESIELTNYMVHVSNDPQWNMEPLEFDACTGEAVELEVSVEGVEFLLEPSVDFGGGLFIPDIVGECFTSDLAFTQFIPNQTVGEGALAIEELFINFEHSYMGDLTISFICPNGQSIMVHSEGGFGTFLGIPVDDEFDPDTPGVGFDYSWSPDATNGTWEDNSGGTLPAGTYESVQPFANLNGCPLNGVWQLEICDLLEVDNGFVFDWSIQFADSLYPVDQAFTPQFGLECDSTFWTTPQQSQHNVLDGAWECADVSVTMLTPGEHTYTAHATNNFGCEYTQDVTVEYVQFSPYIEASSDIFCGGTAVELEVLISAGEEGDLSVTWSNGDFLSDTTGTVVYASGIEQPETFEAVIGQQFDNYPGLTCTATADITIGTCQIKIPNIVTPYRTPSKNDDFRIEGIQSYDDVELVILNRWGNVVFESKDFGNDVYWDCEADNASTGVYYYILTIPVDEGPLVVTDANGTLKEYTGEGPFVFEGTFNIAD